MTPDRVVARQLWFDEPGLVSLRETLLPTLAPGDALIRTTISAVSAGTELLFFSGLVPPNLAADTTISALQTPSTYPIRYGYACVGRVESVGSDGDRDWIGRRVFAFQPHASASVTALSSLLAIPDDVDDESAALLPGAETAVNFVLDGAPALGERVAVLGAGAVGLLTLQLLAAFPLESLLVVDPLAQRRTRALEWGATVALDPQEIDAHRDFDLVYELSGNPDALNTALSLAGYEARIVIGSWYGAKPVALDLGGAFHRQRVRLIASQVSTIASALTGRWTRERRFGEAWRLLRTLHPRLVPTRIPIEKAQDAYSTLAQRRLANDYLLFTYSTPTGPQP